jgi:hypothetical protein
MITGPDYTFKIVFSTVLLAEIPIDEMHCTAYLYIPNFPDLGSVTLRTQMSIIIIRSSIPGGFYNGVFEACQVLSLHRV